jgi:predicted transposase YbfD/YdcC
LHVPSVATIFKVQSRAELSGRCRFDTRYYISSAPLTAGQPAEAVRGHWGVENRLHWVLDVVFREDQSRHRKGHGAKNMAVVTHFAINLVRSAKYKRSIKLHRKVAGWNPNYLADLLNAAGGYLEFVTLRKAARGPRSRRFIRGRGFNPAKPP